MTGQEAYRRIVAAAEDAVNAARERELDRAGTYRKFLDTVIATLDEAEVPWDSDVTSKVAQAFEIGWNSCLMTQAQDARQEESRRLVKASRPAD